jgi:hypothetical protein
MVDVAINTGLWPLLPVFAVLLAIYLLVLGIAVAGLVSAIREREAQGRSLPHG